MKPHASEVEPESGCRSCCAERDFQPPSGLRLNVRTRFTLLLLGAVLGPFGVAFGQPIVTNAATSIYAVVIDPVRLAFAPEGTLFVGRDASGSGGGAGDAVKIHRVAPGGSPVTEYGNDPIPDPDALIVDVAGAVSGTPGAVLVGGVVSNPLGQGRISKIAPDGMVTTLFGPSTSFYNPTDFIFDSSGRLLFTENNDGKVMVTTGGVPTNLISLAGAAYLVEDAAGRLVVSSSSDTTLRLYSTNGVLLNGNLAQAKTGSPLARGRGGIWGTDLYAVAADGALFRVGLSGATNRVGAGFGSISDLQFGPDGALYASDFSSDRIYRFAQPCVPGARTTIYARVTDPVRLSFAPDGTLFAGRDNVGSGGDNDDAVKIHRIGPGGAPVEEYGNAPITDPDAVFYDATGQFSGTPGSVIVAGEQLNSTAGKIVKILPDGSIATIYGPTAFGFNPNVFVHDAAGGRLLFSDDEGGKIWAMTNSTPSPLITLAGVLYFSTDELRRLVVGVSGSSTLRLYSAAGALLTNSFAVVAANSPLASGPGGFWGTGVLCVNTNGDLLSLDRSGVPTQRGSGFGLPWGMAFGPDGALYASEFNSDLIWRIAPDAPRLTVARTESNSVVVSWPLPADGWVLEWTNRAASVSAPWPQILPPYQTNNTQAWIIESAPTGSRYYRLHKALDP
jgi:sugar lactone lactonase YvrE